MKKYQCPCCGYFTYNVPANEDCGYICPVCFWENDPFIASDNEPSDSNHGITLKEAKSNFSKFGACEKEMESTLDIYRLFDIMKARKANFPLERRMT